MDGAGGPTEPSSSLSPSRTSTPSSHSHRFHHAHCASSAAPTPKPSIFLQQRIQQRRAEKKMSEGSLSNSAGSARADSIMSRSSSVRKLATATMRPTPPNTDDDDLNVMGIKEIEKTIEKLKKQNWDLKLELYHRRERQAMLEELAKTSQERAKIMQDEHASIIAQQAETMRLNDDLARELDKRDKALFEAIDMIVDLQTTVAELEREKTMVRIVEADLQRPATSGQIGTFDRGADAKPYQLNSSGLPLATDFYGRLGDPKTLERMSSFLSERGERTANLRDMILHNKSSFFHSRKISEASTFQSDFNRSINRSVSPGVSLLSESSFLSVYGMNKRTPDHMPSPPEPEDTLIMQSIETPGPRRNTRNFSEGSRASSIMTPMAWADSQNKFVDIRSPLQQLERLDGKLSVESGLRSTTSGGARTAPAPISQRQRAHVRTNQEKRESLRRVLTASPNADDLVNARMLPPTPDTTSSSMLGRHQNSNETLSARSSVTPRESLAHEIHMTPVTALPPQISTSSAQGGLSRPSTKLATMERPKGLGQSLSGEEASSPEQIVQTAPQRPRSADETTISRHRANTWDSDSDSDGGADAYSDEANDMDDWMREGAKPNPKSVAPRSTSPDLFSFPTESGRWETDVIFGAMRGTGFMGSPAPGLKRDPIDQLSSSPLIAPEDGVYYPPEPDAPDGGIHAPLRQSSRSARTSSMTGSETTPEKLKVRKGPVRWSDSTRGPGRARSSSIDSAALSSSMRGPPKALGDVSSALKKTNHPPLTGQPTRQKKSSTLNRLFRRSLGSSQDQADEGAEQRLPAHSAHTRPRRSLPSGRSSVPPPATTPWRPPAAVLDSDLTSATPPPIMRSRGLPPNSEQHKSGDKLQTPRASRVVSPSLLHSGTSETDNETDTPQSGRRKWLSLGRRNSLKGRS